jgi:hypothetical protein
MTEIMHNRDDVESHARPADEAPLGREEGSYQHYDQAVRYGVALATLEEHAGKTWEEIRPEARQEWEEKYERPWEEFEPVVHESWREVKTQQATNPAQIVATHRFENAFRQHYQGHYADYRFTYRQCASAYHYGYDLGVDERLRDKTWAEVEPEAHRFWDEADYAAAWEDLKEAVHFAWRVARGSV